MFNSNKIDFKLLAEKIAARHHAIERFYDCDFADRDRAANLEMVERLKNGMASIEDEQAALDIIARN